MTVTTNADVAAKVRGIAAEHRVRQVDIAESLKVSLMAVSRRMNGSTPFSPHELIILGRRFGVPVASFFGEYALTSPVVPVSSPTGTAGVIFAPESRAS